MPEERTFINFREENPRALASSKSAPHLDLPAVAVGKRRDSEATDDVSGLRRGDELHSSS